MATIKQSFHNPAYRSYWEAILFEVQHRDDEKCNFYYIPHQGSEITFTAAGATNDEAKKNLPQLKIFLGEQYPDVYLTRQEAHCIHSALRFKTMKKVAADLAISTRTVEYYLTRVRKKIGAANKKSLLKKITQTDFLNNYEHYIEE